MFEIFTWIGVAVVALVLLAMNSAEQKHHERRQAALKGWATRRARQAGDRG